MRRMRTWAQLLAPAGPILLLWAIAPLLFAVPAHAQDNRPSDDNLELPAYEREPDGAAPLRIEPLPEVPSFAPPRRTPGAVLPPLRDRGPDGDDQPSASSRLVLREIDIVGNSAIDESVLGEITRAYLDRPLSFSDLQTLRDELTLAYVSRGYITSGAVLPDQESRDGRLTIQIVEGRLDGIQIQTDGRLHEGYVRRQIERGVTRPLDVNALELALQILQQDERIRRVEATLVPNPERGSATLRVRIAERRPWSARLAGNNYNSPSIGSARGEVAVAHANVTGLADTLALEYKGSEGLHDVRGSWEVPIAPFETRLEVHSRLSWSEVVESPFDELDIESRTETYGVGITQPVYRSMNALVETFAIAEWRRSRSYIFGNEPFSFSIGPINGTGQETVLRLGTMGSHSTRSQAFAARGVLSLGIDALNVTKNSGTTPDGRFVAFLGQLQWARQLPWWGLQLIARGDLQLSDRALLGLEQYSMGGHASVRGYRENARVTDNGVLGSVELRVPIPVPRLGGWRPRLELVPFADVGHAWNVDRSEPSQETLASVGLGTRIGLAEHAVLQVFWGRNLTRVEEAGEHDPQDDGVHAEISFSW